FDTGQSAKLDILQCGFSASGDENVSKIRHMRVYMSKK
ncbi:MAG: hypothetical protein K1000chlam4_00123, partial [Chlamydiae bacterium]|nr:hypothetical protein [Chlamydiota bacterium]